MVRGEVSELVAFAALLSQCSQNLQAVSDLLGAAGSGAKSHWDSPLATNLITDTEKTMVSILALKKQIDDYFPVLGAEIVDFTRIQDRR